MGGRSWKSTASKKKKPVLSWESGPEGKGDGRSFDAAKQAAYRILSYRDRTSHELRAKLNEKGFSDEVISEVILFLQEIGALNDLRFARQWARSRMERLHFGPIRLRQELLEKGVSAEETEALLNQLSEEHDPVTSAEEALTRRFQGGTLHVKEPALLGDLAAQKRAFAFLQRKGFSTEIILKVFRKMGKR